MVLEKQYFEMTVAGIQVTSYVIIRFLQEKVIGFYHFNGFNNPCGFFQPGGYFIFIITFINAGLQTMVGRVADYQP